MKWTKGKLKAPWARGFEIANKILRLIGGTGLYVIGIIFLMSGFMGLPDVDYFFACTLGGIFCLVVAKWGTEDLGIKEGKWPL